MSMIKPESEKSGIKQDLKNYESRSSHRISGIFLKRVAATVASFKRAAACWARFLPYPVPLCHGQSQCDLMSECKK